ncbi:MarR family winged helix-turn-helix transcriptional regulator [Nonomuraea jabiensis]|uniref:MarR family winged helix-turn-helix transcriptional regulator n=1 Tax=Nonomuraea jabiensis TaxID=882448 RepID=UPI003D71F806
MPHPAPDPELARALLELSCVIEGIRAAVSRELGLTPQQAQLLTAVHPRELAHGELANRLHCDKTNITGLVNRLEHRGLVRRRPDLDDRRLTKVFLTDQGTELVTRFRDAMSTVTAKHFASWPAARHSQLLDLLRTATETLHG